MRYFTPELYVRGQAPDTETQQEVDRLWEEAVERYEQQLERIRPVMPPHLRCFLDDLLLHDAEVLSLARQGDRFLMALRTDYAPRELVLLAYALTAEPVIDTSALPREYSDRDMAFIYNEVDLVQDGDDKVYTESILFSNGWEVQLRFRDVQVIRAEEVYPVPRTPQVPLPTSMGYPLA